MMQPKRTKYRKQFKGKISGSAQRGNFVAFGEYGLKATDRCRMTAREIEAARRAASISRAVIRHRSVALSPYSPNATKLPRCALPEILPLNCLRYLVRFGCIMCRYLVQPAAGAAVSTDLAPAAAAASASASVSSASGLSNTSPLNIQTLMPMTPYVVCASATP